MYVWWSSETHWCMYGGQVRDSLVYVWWSSERLTGVCMVVKRDSLCIYGGQVRLTGVCMVVK